MHNEVSNTASGEHAGPGDQQRRPARATGLPTRRVSRRQAWSRRSLSSWRRTRQLLAAAFVAIVGVGVLLRARAAIDERPATPPSVIVAEPPLADNIADVAAPTTIPTVIPPPLAVSPLVTPTSVASPTPTAAPLAAIPAAAPTPNTTPSVAPRQEGVPSAVPQATTTPVPAASEAANAEPESTAPTEEAPPEAEPAMPTPAPSQPSPAYRTYVVQPGDILKQIAARYGVSMVSIIAINNIPNADSLRVGQVLRIPPAGS